MIIEKALIMNIGKTANDFNLTKEMVLNSIESFKNKPIIYNKQQELKHCTEDIVIGFILEKEVKVTDLEVFADIFVFDEYKNLWDGKYNNWSIQLSDSENKFQLLSIEVF
jgi:hypothetical protein